MDKVINVVIIGAGEDSIPIIKTLVTLKNFKVLGIADEKKDAPGLAVARELGINTDLSFIELVKLKGLNLIIEISGSPYFAKTLEKMLAGDIKIIDGVSARLSLELAAERERLLKVETAYKLTQRYSHIIEESNKKLDDKILELSLLNESSKTFSAAFDQRNVAGFIFSLLKKKINFCTYALLLVEEESQTIVLTSGREISADLKEEIILRMSERFSKYAGAAIDIKHLSIIEKTAKGQDQEDKEPIEPPIKTLYTAPLTVLDKPLGMMGIIFCREYSLTVDDERFFDILTAQLALFIENDRIKQAITNERNRLESILQSMIGAVLVIDRKKEIVLINPVTEIFLGVKAKEVLGLSVNDAISQKEIKTLFSAIGEQKSEFLTKEIQIVNSKDGITRFVKANLAKIRDYLGNIIGTVLVLYDITKEKEIDRMKTEFISTTSHELRTPLASIKEAISLISDGTTGSTNENQRKFLDIAVRNIDRLAALINSLLDLSKIESGKMKLERAMIDVNKIIHEVIDTFQVIAKDKKIRLEARLEKKLPKIQADRDKILQIIVNLVSNAIKFTPKKGKITVQTSFYGSDTNFLKITVQDTGIGIDKKDFDKLFQKFQQLDSSMTRKVSGTGLGLAISKQIVEMHGGKIWVESEPAAGSVFNFILPVKKEVKNGKTKSFVS